MKFAGTLCAGLVLAGLTLAPVANAAEAEARMIERGRYLAKIAGCNDCHTPDYAEKGGRVPEEKWLTGDALGWRGPWGTTYPINLRLYFNGISEEQWVVRAKSLMTRPPMPWFSVRDMSEQDLRAFYRYVRKLGPAGKPAPAHVPPGRDPTGPVVTFPAPPK